MRSSGHSAPSSSHSLVSQTPSFSSSHSSRFKPLRSYHGTVFSIPSISSLSDSTMTDMTTWPADGNRPPLDSLLDLPESFDWTDSHEIQSMDISWLNDDTFSSGLGLFGGDNPTNGFDSDECAFPYQLQDADILGLESFSDLFVGEPHDLLPLSVAPQSIANLDVDEAVPSGQNEKRPSSPTFYSPKPVEKKRGISLRSPKRRSKLAATARKVLEDFFNDNAYPEPKDVAMLVDQTGVDGQQIKTWFRNQRSRKLNVDISSSAGDIQETSGGQLDQTFATGLAEIPHIDPKSLMERYLGIPLDQDNHMPTSEPREDQATVGSDSSWGSCGSQKSWSSRRGRRKIPKRHQPREAGVYDPGSEPHRFRCTFCGEGLKDRYQWRRHEEAKHAPRTGWLCREPECSEKPIEDAIFLREDLFKQHHKTHTTEALPKVDIISANPVPEAHPALRCGFCGECLPDWDTRVTHVAAHFEGGANLSSWWLERTEFLAATVCRNFSARIYHQIGGLDACALSYHDFGAVFHNSVYCTLCGRLYLSLSEAQAHHSECTVWSCGFFAGIQAAYEKSRTSVWSCVYCDEMILEFGPDHSERLSHLVRHHAYRSCAPQAFVVLAHFQDHLRLSHNRSIREDATLEKACQFTRESRFRPALDGSGDVRPSISLSPSLFSDATSFAWIDIVGRGAHGNVQIVPSVVRFEAGSLHNIIDRNAVQTLHDRIDLTLEQNEQRMLVKTSERWIVETGELVIQWVDLWGKQQQTELLQLAPKLHTTRFRVEDLESQPRAPRVVIGRVTMEELGIFGKDHSAA